MSLTKAAAGWLRSWGGSMMGGVKKQGGGQPSPALMG